MNDRIGSSEQQEPEKKKKKTGKRKKDANLIRHGNVQSIHDTHDQSGLVLIFSNSPKRRIKSARTDSEQPEVDVKSLHLGTRGDYRYRAGGRATEALNATDEHPSVPALPD